MSSRDEPEQSFQAEALDEQLARLTRDTTSSADAHLIHDLRAISREYTRSGEQVWQRLATRQVQQEKTPRMLKPVVTNVNNPTERSYHMQIQSPENNTLPSERPRPPRGARRVFSLVAALLLITALVGSLATLLELSHQRSFTYTGSGQGSPTSAPSPTTSVPVGAPGHVIYSTPQERGTVGDLAWSADGQRVAALVGGQIHIWDATTGKHAVTVQLPGAGVDAASSVAWSPTSELLAIPARSGMVIVNGQTGHIVATYTGSGSTATRAPSTGGGYLDSRFPASGGWYGFMALAWSPDGKEIASAFFASPDSTVQIWNTQTGHLSSTFAMQTGAVINELAWSSDGKDIAASLFLLSVPPSSSQSSATPSATATTVSGAQTSSQVIVWNVATQQSVFTQSSELNMSGLSWQPGSNHLAFFTAWNTTQNAVKPTQGLQIWNVTTNSLLKSLPDLFVSAFAWSPDGKEFAYESPSQQGAEVVLLNVASDQTVSPYEVSNPAGQGVTISGLAWSPDGKYLATAENLTSEGSPEGLTPTSAGNPSPTTTPSSSTYRVRVWVA